MRARQRGECMEKGEEASLEEGEEKKKSVVRHAFMFNAESGREQHMNELNE